MIEAPGLRSKTFNSATSRVIHDSICHSLDLLPLGLTRNGGARRDRTDDLLRARQALSQLSYGPSENWWVWEDLNFRPHPYQGCALTN
jgi:hypothetical protein